MKIIQAIAVAATALAAPVQAADWNGFYLGGQIGYGFGEVSDGGTPSFDGVIGGVHAGYNHDLGSVVIGAEIDYNLGDMEVGGGVTFDQLAHTKVKLGYDGGRFLAYGTAGAAWANASLGPLSADDFGYMVGAGLDYQLTDRITLGGEYNYNIFNSFNNSPSDIDIHTVQARMSFHF